MTSPVSVTGELYSALHADKGITPGLLRVWAHRGKVMKVGVNERGETLYDLASLNRAERAYSTRQKKAA